MATTPPVPRAAQKLSAADWISIVTGFIGAITPLVVNGPAYFAELMKVYEAFGFSRDEAIAHIRQSEIDVHAFDDFLQQSGAPIKHPGSQIPG